MNDILLKNIDKIHTTLLGEKRIYKNVKINNIVTYTKNILNNENYNLEKKGKNYYIFYNNIVITINSFSYTIITVHFIK